MRKTDCDADLVKAQLFADILREMTLNKWGPVKTMRVIGCSMTAGIIAFTISSSVLKNDPAIQPVQTTKENNKEKESN